MALIFFSGFETGDFGEWTSSFGSPAVVEADGWGAPKTGNYCMECDTTGGAAFYTVWSGTHYPRDSVYIYITTAPNVDIFLIRVYGLQIYLTTAREIDVYDGDGKQADGSTVIALNTWTRVSGAFHGTNDTASVWIDGNIEHNAISLTNPTLSNVSCGIGTSATAHIYFDDFIGDDTVDTLTDIGDIRVLRSSPSGAGQYNTFDTISGFGNCDEVPASDADYVDDSGVEAFHAECYNLQDATTIGVGASDTWKAVNVWTRLYTVNAGGGIVVRDNGVDYKTAKDVGKAYTWANKLYDTNAPRASAWTSAIFDAFQGGAYNEGKTDLHMSCVMVMVAYTPVSGQDYPISLSPGLTASATVAYLIAYDRSVAPGLTAAVTIAYKAAWDRSVDTGLTVSATIAKVLGRLITTTAGLTASVTVAYKAAWDRSVEAGLTTAVTILKGWGRKITTSAGLTASATIAIRKGFNKSLAPGLTTSATVAYLVAYKRALSPGLTASVTVAYLVAYKRAVQAGLTASVTILKGWGRTLTMSPGLTVSVTILKGWGRTITTSAGLTVSATISKAVAYKRAIASGLTTAVTVAYKIAYKRAIAPGLTVSTTIIATFVGVTNYLITIVSNLTVSATVDRTVAYHRAVSTSLTLAVTILKSWGRTITTSAGLTVSTTVARAVAYKRAVSTGLTAAVSAVVSYVMGFRARSQFQVELFVSPPPRDIYFTDIEEEITFE